jgi:hypothetical protein
LKELPGEFTADCLLLREFFKVCVNRGIPDGLDSAAGGIDRTQVNIFGDVERQTADKIEAHHSCSPGNRPTNDSEDVVFSSRSADVDSQVVEG